MKPSRTTGYVCLPRLVTSRGSRAFVNEFVRRAPERALDPTPVKPNAAGISRACRAAPGARQARNCQTQWEKYPIGILPLNLGKFACVAVVALS